MAWISEVSNGGEQRSAQRIRCDLCSWETEEASWGPTDARVGAGVYWPEKDEHQGEGEPAWCPRCASRPVTNLQVEVVMKWYWRAPTKAPPPGTSSQAHPPEKKLAALEEEVAGLRLLEEQVAGLRLRVAELEAELEGHSSGAATGWMLF